MIHHHPRKGIESHSKTYYGRVAILRLHGNILLTSSAVCRNDPGFPSAVSRVLPTNKKKTDSGVPIEALSIYMTHTILLLAIIVQEMHSVINTSQHSLARAFKTDL